MGKQYSALNDDHVAFIERQHLFFVGTATADSRVNISPKGMNTLKVIDEQTVIWLNVTGSGNETAAHVKTHPRMTIMFAAFDGKPMILRLYGEAEAIHHNDQEWGDLYAQFEPIQGARQIFRLNIDMVQRSCGMAVPNFDYVADRDYLKKWATTKGDDGLKAYWQEKNQYSIDGIPTDIVAANIEK